MKTDGGAQTLMVEGLRKRGFGEFWANDVIIRIYKVLISSGGEGRTPYTSAP